MRSYLGKQRQVLYAVPVYNLMVRDRSGVLKLSADHQSKALCLYLHHNLMKLCCNKALACEVYILPARSTPLRRRQKMQHGWRHCAPCMQWTIHRLSQ